MLWTDTDVCTASLLSQVDSEVASVAASTKPALVIEGPASMCELAWNECSRVITAAMQTYTSYLAQPGVSGGHVAAVLNTGVQARNQARTRLNQIVAHESQYGSAVSAVEMWAVYSALAVLFRAASARLAKDRLEEKFKRYLDEAERAWRLLRQNGLPYVSQPLEAPGAKHGVSPGTWGQANVSGVSGAVTGAMNVDVAVTYIDSSKYASQASKGNGESGPSAVISFALPAAQALKVDVTSLTPPTGVMDAVGLSQGAWTPLTASGWNVWVGDGTGTLYLQNASPIAIGTKTYTLSSDPVFGGYSLGRGQFPELMLTFTNMVGRG